MLETRYEQRRVLGFIVVACMGLGTAIYMKHLRAYRDPALTESIVSQLSPTANHTAETIVILHVAGAVTQPGLYTLKTGQRVSDAITLAGGLLPISDADQLNMARCVKDGEQLYVPFASTAQPIATSVRLSINRASVSDWQGIRGIGPQTAARLVAYRNKNGPFLQLDDLEKVKGIGPKKMAKIQPYLRL